MDLMLPEDFFKKFADQCAKWADVNVELQKDITPGAVRKEMLDLFEHSLSDAWRERFPFK